MGEHNNQFRNIPEASSRSGFRDFVQHKATRFGIIAAASLALATCGTSKAPPQTTAPAYSGPPVSALAKTETQHIQEAFGYVAIIPFEHHDYEINDPETAEGKYGILDSQKIYEEILGTLNNQGQYDPNLRQYNHNLSYMPLVPQPQLESINEKVAFRLTNRVMADLASASSGSALPIRLSRAEADQFLNGQGYTESRACVVALPSESLSADDLIAKFTGHDAPTLQQIRMADFYQFIASHEAYHCVDPELDERNVVAGEARADLYAIARHVQVYGDDGFAQTWHDLRSISAINQGTFDHDTAPILGLAITPLLEAKRNGELEGLDAKQLYAKVEEMTAEAAGQTPEELWRGYMLDTATRFEAIDASQRLPRDANGHIIYDEATVDKYGLALSDEAEQNIRDVIAEHNTARDRVFAQSPEFYDKYIFAAQSVFFGNPTPEQQAKNFAVARYRANIEDVMSVQDTRRDAYSVVTRALWEERELDRKGENAPARGLEPNERQMILREYRDSLAEELGIKQEQQPEREQSIG